MRFHIHVDAATVSPDFERSARLDLGFERDDFNPLPSAGIQAFRCNHLSKKLGHAREFEAVFNQIAGLAQSSNGLVGYIEGECVARRHELEAASLAGDCRPPFSVVLGELAPGHFRETEIHISTLAKDANSHTVRALVEAGFFLAHKGTSANTRLVFTIQGSVATIKPLYSVLADWLAASGALGPCTIKEERIRRYWLSSAEVFRPPVVRNVIWGSLENGKRPDA
jgi:hypothetical protein